MILICHDIRSTHNVGSLLRTAEGLGVEKVYLTGYTPYPELPQDDRLPHLAATIAARIHKTALDAEHLITWEHHERVEPVLAGLQREGYQLVALEQSPKSIKLADFIPGERVALLIGREVEGIASTLLERVDAVVEIPMLGHKESFNVVQATAMALYRFRFQ